MFDLTKKENLVLALILEKPNKEFYIRGIAKKLKISPSTAKLSVDKLKKQGLIVEKTSPVVRMFRANMESNLVQERKKIKNLDMIKRSDILDKIQNPISAILFGSFAKGTNDEKSDIDILIITNNKKPINLLDIKGYELQIIQLTPLEWKEKAKGDKPFYQEIITTGIPLKGELPV